MARPPWHSWYATARWRKLRTATLVRDRYTCQATGILLIGSRHAPNSAVVDHRRPHRGNAELFWDPDNLWSVSKAYHDRIKQAEEQSSLQMRGTWD